jgi:hypothetical protein
MARYGNVVYKGAFYGEVPRTPFSVEPFIATALDYDRILVTWNTPVGDLTGIRLVRNQEGFSECPEDGVILLEVNNTDGDFGSTSYIDGVDNLLDSSPDNDIGLVSGRWVYYRMWVRRSDDLWTVANDAFTILPRKHGTNLPDGTELQSTQINFMDLLPRVFTSAEQSPLGTIDSSSTLYQFLEGMSFTLDEMLTLADLLLPDSSGRNAGPGLLQLQLAEYGLQQEEPDAIVRKKRMVREALYMYSRKGTPIALGTMIESLTGYAPTISPTNNLLLTVQDGTFYKDLGFWRSVGPGSLSLETKVRTPETELKSIDADYCAKVVTTGIGARIENGTFRPTTRGVPLPEIGEYTFSYYLRQPSGMANDVVASIVWYDESGKELSRASETHFGNSLGEWSRNHITATSPGFQGVISSYSVSANILTVTLTDPHPISIGQTVAIAGLGDPFDLLAEVVATTANSISVAIEAEDVVETEAEGLVSSARAVYAGLVLSFSAADTYYVDLMAFSQGELADYEEPRGVNIFLGSVKANYINNPSFVAEGTPWVSATAAQSYVESTLPFIYAGNTMLALEPLAPGPVELTTTIPPQNLPIDKAYVFSVYLQSPDETRDVSLKITLSDGEETLTRTSDPVTVGEEWTRPYVELYVPSNLNPETLQATVEILFDSNSASPMYVEAAQLENGYRPTDYFDGSFPPEYGVTWAGVENQSASHCYKIKQVKIIRLIQELENYLPSNTPYFITSYAGTEVTGVTL